MVVDNYMARPLEKDRKGCIECDYTCRRQVMIYNIDDYLERNPHFDKSDIIEIHEADYVYMPCEDCC